MANDDLTEQRIKQEIAKLHAEQLAQEALRGKLATENENLRSWWRTYLPVLVNPISSVAVGIVAAVLTFRATETSETQKLRDAQAQLTRDQLQLAKDRTDVTTQLSNFAIQQRDSAYTERDSATRAANDAKGALGQVEKQRQNAASQLASLKEDINVAQQQRDAAAVDFLGQILEENDAPEKTQSLSGFLSREIARDVRYKEARLAYVRRQADDVKRSVSQRLACHLALWQSTGQATSLAWVRSTLMTDGTAYPSLPYIIESGVFRGDTDLSELFKAQVKLRPPVGPRMNRWLIAMSSAFPKSVLELAPAEFFELLDFARSGASKYLDDTACIEWSRLGCAVWEFKSRNSGYEGHIIEEASGVPADFASGSLHTPEELRGKSRKFIDLWMEPDFRRIRASRPEVLKKIIDNKWVGPDEIVPE